MLTDRPSLSLGAEEYKAIVSDAGLTLVGEVVPESRKRYRDFPLPPLTFVIQDPIRVPASFPEPEKPGSTGLSLPK